MLQRQPVLVLRRGTNKDTGRRAQEANFAAGRAVADIIRTTMGPRSMLKMLVNPMGTVVLTNDGNAILREIDVAHPAAKSIIELSRAQKEEVGDGTTTVVVLAGEILACVEPLIQENIHPTIIVGGIMQALEDSLVFLRQAAQPIAEGDVETKLRIVASASQTKTTAAWQALIPKMALDAVEKIKMKRDAYQYEVDVKRYAQIIKIPGGNIGDSMVLDGVLLNKDVTHPKMRRYIENPKVLLLDSSLEYKKAESATNVEITKEEDWEKLLMQEEIEIRKMTDYIIASGCNVCITEKGVSDLAQHYLMKANISVIRRVRKTDNNRIARVTGATICSRMDEITEKDVGEQAGLFEIRSIGEESYAYITKSREAHACSIVLRGPTKDVLSDVERTLHTALMVARNVVLEPMYVAGGGATEMEISARLLANAANVEPARAAGYKAVAQALRVIPRTLLNNSGSNVLRQMSELEALHVSEGNANMGVCGLTGKVVDVTRNGLIDSLAVKAQAYKSAVEAAALIIRVDNILSGVTRKEKQ